MMYWKCACGMTNEETTLACVGCGWTKPIEYPKAESTRVGGLLDPNNRHVVGLIGSLLLFIGVFCPIVSAPIIGNINYFQNGKGDGVLIIILVGISLALTFRKQY